MEQVAEKIADGKVLNGLDWKMARSGYEMVRYAEDFVVLCSNQEEAQQALEQISQ